MKASAKSFVASGLMAACALLLPVRAAAQYSGKVSVDNNTDWFTKRGEPTDMPGRIVYMPKARYVKQMQEVGPDQCIPPNPSWTLVAQNDTHCWYEVPQQKGANDDAWKTEDGVASCHDQGGGTLYCEVRKIIDGVGLVIDVWRAVKNRFPDQPTMPGCTQTGGVQLCPDNRRVLPVPTPGGGNGGTPTGPPTSRGPPSGGRPGSGPPGGRPGNGGPGNGGPGNTPGNGGTPGGGTPGNGGDTGDPNANNVLHGLVQGFQECGPAFANLGRAALALVHPQLILQNRNYVVAARYMGIQSSDQGLRFLYSELTQPAVGVTKDASGKWKTTVTDDQAGTRIARKICFWGLPAVVTKMAKELGPGAKSPRGPPSKSGSQPPLAGALSEAQVLEKLQEAAAENGDAAQLAARNLEGEAVQLPPGEGVNPGVVKLGGRIGDGHFGDVYTMEGAPNQVLKVIHKLQGGAQSVVREAGGAGLLKGLVRTPGIRGLRNGGDTGLSYIIKDKIPDIEVPNDLTPELEPFVGRIYSTLANNGLVWLDGHLNNLYIIRDAAGKVVDIGIHDTDMINTANDTAVAGEMGRIVRLFQREAVPGQTPPMARLFNYSNLAKQGTLDAHSFMRDLYEMRFDVKAPF